MKNYSAEELDLILGSLYRSLSEGMAQLNQGVKDGLDMDEVHDGCTKVEELLLKIIKDIRDN